ncbi:MAG: 6-pyruvoyl trahydropterin synthase family protein [Panacagrimonas sp.]
MTILFVEQLTVLDFAYLDPQRGLVGESWIVHVELEGELDRQSMVLDFGEVKRSLKRLIDGSMDHTLLVPEKAPETRLTEVAGSLEVQFTSARGLIEHRSPRCAVTCLPDAVIEPDSVAEYLVQLVRPVVPASVRRVGFQLLPEAIAGPSYHYVHGLKKHQGHCQRIAHGHRSKIEVRAQGQRDSELEQQIAQDWADIYLGTRDDVIAQRPDRIRFGYESPEGRFELELPASCVDLLETDSTVERIAEHLLAASIERRPGARLEIRAYEGVMKGAIARS